MNKYDIKYDEIQKGSCELNEQIATKIITELEHKLHISFSLGQQYTSFQTLLLLLTTEYNPYLMDIISKYDYTYSTEIQYAIANLCSLYSQPQLSALKQLTSIKEIMTDGHSIKLHTSLGNVTIYKATSIFQNINCFIQYGLCHHQAHNFIHNYPQLSATTSLLSLPFGGYQYHSYVNYEDHVIDLAHNAYMSKQDYQKIFQPKELNMVFGCELKSEEERINSIESLSNNKELLLRLALDKQVK